MRAITAVAVWVLVSGCYRYYPAATPIPPAGVRVAAELSDSGTVVLARTVGPGVSTVEGRVVRADTEEIELSVTTVRQHDGRESGWRGERITVPRNLLTGLQERKFSRSRTALFSVALR